MPWIPADSSDDDSEAESKFGVFTAVLKPLNDELNLCSLSKAQFMEHLVAVLGVLEEHTNYDTEVRHVAAVLIKCVAMKMESLEKENSRHQARYNNELSRLASHSKKELEKLHDTYRGRVARLVHANRLLTEDLEQVRANAKNESESMSQKMADFKLQCIEWESQRRGYVHTIRTLKVQEEELQAKLIETELRAQSAEKEVVNVNKQLYSELTSNYRVRQDLATLEEKLVVKQCDIDNLEEQIINLKENLLKKKNVPSQNKISTASTENLTPRPRISRLANATVLPPGGNSEAQFPVKCSNTREAVARAAKVLGELRTLLYNSNAMIAAMVKQKDISLQLAGTDDVVPHDVTFAPMGSSSAVPPPLRWEHEQLPSVGLSRQQIHSIIRDIFKLVSEEELKGFGMAKLPLLPFTRYLGKYMSHTFGDHEISMMYSLLDGCASIRQDPVVNMFLSCLERRIGLWVVVQVEVQLDQIREAIAPFLTQKRVDELVIQAGDWCSLVENLYGHVPMSDKAALKYVGCALPELVVDTLTDKLPILRQFDVTLEGESLLIATLRRQILSRVLKFRTIFEMNVTKTSVENDGQLFATRPVVVKSLHDTMTTCDLEITDATNDAVEAFVSIVLRKLDALSEDKGDKHEQWQHDVQDLEGMLCNYIFPERVEPTKECTEVSRDKARQAEFPALLGFMKRRLGGWTRPRTTVHPYATPEEWGAGKLQEKKSRRRLKQAAKSLITGRFTKVVAQVQQQQLYPLCNLILTSRTIPIIGLSEVEAF